ncbi:AAA family ATPase [Rothia mucilaginosa]|uniref:AAA family ATPase n=1 Tax=Rothia mucilaginosa TaxID=43675 RepID=UPI0026EC2F34|nr:AAA family ATPase [Rothia mucilaginosa]
MVDATKVSKITIDTGYAGVKEYPFFTRAGKNGQSLLDARCAIVLGKNGSGKSTIARVLSSENSEVEFLDKDGIFIGSDYSNVYVFDEWFIGENFRMSDQDTLNLITEIKKLKPLFETINAFNGILDPFRESMKHLIAMPQINVMPQVNFIKQMDRALQVAKSVSENSTNYGYFKKTVFGNLQSTQGINYLRLKEGQLSGDSDESHETFEKPKKMPEEGFDESGAGDVSDVNDAGLEESGAGDVSDADEWQEMWDNLSSGERKKITEQLLEASKAARQINEQLGEQIRGIFSRPRIVRDPRKAINNINALSAIVFGADSISVKYKEGEDGEDGYEILRGNKKVVPSSLSTGEQNALSLCYFFAQMMDGEEHGSLEEVLVGNRIIVLDDPLSSFDFDNKYGVVRLLDYVMNLMSKSDSESKLIIMTHDPEVAIELSKIAISRLGGEKVKCCEISNNYENTLLKNVKFDGIDEYKNILGKMYGIAVGKEDVEMPAPNEVRRVWEAFLRFELGVSSVSDRKAIEKIRDYYDEESVEYEFLDSFMSYAFIHQDSHSASQMLFFNFSLFPVLSDEDFRRHIGQIVCFIHIVSPLHIASRLSNDGTEAQDYREELENMYKQIVLKES